MNNQMHCLFLLLYIFFYYILMNYYMHFLNEYNEIKFYFLILMNSFLKQNHKMKILKDFL